MVDIKGKPLIDYHLEQLIEQGFRDITLSLGYLAEDIKYHLTHYEKNNLKINYLIEYDRLGSGGWLNLCLPDDYLVIFGDILSNMEYRDLINYHYEKNADAVIVTHPTNHMHDSDMIEIDENNRILRIHRDRDKLYQNLSSAGIFTISKNIIDLKSNSKKFDLVKDFFSILLKEYSIYSYKTYEFLKDIGTPSRLEEAERKIEAGLFEQFSKKTKQKAIFFDLDGTLMPDYETNFNFEKYKLFPESGEVINKLHDKGYLCILITNQPQPAKGFCTVEVIKQKIYCVEKLLNRHKAYLDGIYYCVHHPEKGHPGENKLLKKECECRKPAIGNILKAVKEFNIDLSHSYFVGDTAIDIQTAKNAGIKSILIKDKENDLSADYKINSLMEILEVIK